MAHAKKPDSIFRQHGWVHLNRQGRQFSRLLAAEVCASAVVMLDTASSEVVWRVLATQSILQFPLHFPSYASLCAITFQLDSATYSSSPVVAQGKLRHGNTCYCRPAFSLTTAPWTDNPSCDSSSNHTYKAHPPFQWWGPNVLHKEYSRMIKHWL